MDYLDSSSLVIYCGLLSLFLFLFVENIQEVQSNILPQQQILVSLTE